MTICIVIHMTKYIVMYMTLCMVIHRSGPYRPALAGQDVSPRSQNDVYCHKLQYSLSYMTIHFVIYDNIPWQYIPAGESRPVRAGLQGPGR